MSVNSSVATLNESIKSNITETTNTMDTEIPPKTDTGGPTGIASSKMNGTNDKICTDSPNSIASDPSLPETDPVKIKEREDRVRVVREKQAEERMKKLEELRSAQRKAQEFREKQQEDRQRKLQEMRRKEDEHRKLVDERRRKFLEEENERREQILKKTASKDAKLSQMRTAQRNKSDGGHRPRSSQSDNTMSSDDISPARKSQMLVPGKLPGYAAPTVASQARVGRSSKKKFTASSLSSSRSKSAEIGLGRGKSHSDLKESLKSAIDRLSQPKSVPPSSREKFEDAKSPKVSKASSPLRPIVKQSAPPAKPAAKAMTPPARVVPKDLPMRTSLSASKSLAQNKVKSPMGKLQSPMSEKVPSKVSTPTKEKTPKLGEETQKNNNLIKAKSPAVTPKAASPTEMLTSKEKSPVREKNVNDNNKSSSKPASREKSPEGKPEASSPVPSDLDNESKLPEPKLSKEDEYKAKIAAKRKEAREKAEEEQRLAEEKARQEAEEEKRQMEEAERLAAEARKAEEDRLQKAIEENERKKQDELKRIEAERLEKEELEQKHKEEAEKKELERQARLKIEEEERSERKKRLDMIMSRTRNKKDVPESKSQEDLLNAGSPTCNSPTEEMENNASSANNSGNFKSPLLQQMIGSRLKKQEGDDSSDNSCNEEEKSDIGKSSDSPSDVEEKSSKDEQNDFPSNESQNMDSNIVNPVIKSLSDDNSSSSDDKSTSSSKFKSPLLQKMMAAKEKDNKVQPNGDEIKNEKEVSTEDEQSEIEEKSKSCKEGTNQIVCDKEEISTEDELSEIDTKSISEKKDVLPHTEVKKAFEEQVNLNYNESDSDEVSSKLSEKKLPFGMADKLNGHKLSSHVNDVDSSDEADEIPEYQVLDAYNSEDKKMHEMNGNIVDNSVNHLSTKINLIGVVGDSDDDPSHRSDSSELVNELKTKYSSNNVNSHDTDHFSHTENMMGNDFLLDNVMEPSFFPPHSINRNPMTMSMHGDLMSPVDSDFPSFTTDSHHMPSPGQDLMVMSAFGSLPEYSSTKDNTNKKDIMSQSLFIESEENSLFCNMQSFEDANNINNGTAMEIDSPLITDNRLESNLDNLRGNTTEQLENIDNKSLLICDADLINCNEPVGTNFTCTDADDNTNLLENMQGITST